MPAPAPTSRRRFLSWFAASPLFAQSEDILTDPKLAINVLDFEAAARRALPPAHWGYLSTGVEDDLTLKANRAAYSRYYLRPRRLIDVTKAIQQTEIFGQTWLSPIGLSPIGNMMCFHPEGELAAARAAGATNTLQILSTMTNTPLVKVNEALGRPAWYQLYPTSRWQITEQLVRRALDAGTEIMLLTVDTQAGRRTETFERLKKLDSRPCASCHGIERGDFYRRKAMFTDLDTKDLGSTNPALTWKHVDLIRKLAPRVKLLIKGIETHEDARVCVESGLDGVVVSNHGGRAGETNRGTLDCLPEIVDAVNKRMPVLIDGGVRRGADVFKAIALGARVVCIGRPYIWGLAAFGQNGVERVITMLRMELELVMKQCGVRSIAEIKPAHVGRLQA